MQSKSKMCCGLETLLNLTGCHICGECTVSGVHQKQLCTMTVAIAVAAGHVLMCPAA